MLEGISGHATETGVPLRNMDLVRADDAGGRWLLVDGRGPGYARAALEAAVDAVDWSVDRPADALAALHAELEARAAGDAALRQLSAASAFARLEGDRLDLASHGPITAVLLLDELERLDVGDTALPDGATLLLCTRGVLRDQRSPLQLADLQRIAAQRHPRDAARDLVRAAVAAGSVDNATALVVHFEELD